MFLFRRPLDISLIQRPPTSNLLKVVSCKPGWVAKGCSSGLACWFSSSFLAVLSGLSSNFLLVSTGFSSSFLGVFVGFLVVCYWFGFWLLLLAQPMPTRPNRIHPRLVLPASHASCQWPWSWVQNSNPEGLVLGEKESRKCKNLACFRML